MESYKGFASVMVPNRESSTLREISNSFTTVHAAIAVQPNPWQAAVDSLSRQTG